ncbi:MAG: O-acetylhomoserine aminocarboxypropyltransferase/cysteine synthase [Spirochaetes bacterium]|nr:O-acetylhomoserine aminocarboxypropyltransferase/cysteine synthase [Spirochaetota bacterium]
MSGFETKAIHEGATPDAATGAVALPLYESAAFAYPTAEGLASVFAGKEFGYVYSRIANPTVTAFERKMTALEEGFGSLAVSSGMAAIATAVFALAIPGDEIVASKSLFGGTLSFFNGLVKRQGIVTVYVDATDIAAYAAAVTERTRLIFVETIGNPKLDVPDIASIANVARAHNVPLVVDGTLSTPYLFKAKDAGAALVIHSATKYITGNGTAIGGVIVDCGTYDWGKSPNATLRTSAAKAGASAFLSVARKEIVTNTGNCLSPLNAFLHYLGLETLALRMERHCGNAQLLADHLSRHSKVTSVNYPGLASNPDHNVADRQFNGRFGGVVTVTLGTSDAARACINNLRLAKNLANVGDAKTLVIHPASTIYRDTPAEEMRTAGVSDDMIRVSVGIETIDDIIADFDAALTKV